MRTAPYGGAVQAPRKLAYSNHSSILTSLNTGTCNHMFLDTKPNKNLPKVSLPTDAQHPTGTSCAGRRSNEMPPRESRRRGDTRAASSSLGPATHVSHTCDIFSKDPKASGKSPPGRAGQREAPEEWRDDRKRVPPPSHRERTTHSHYS